MLIFVCFWTTYDTPYSSPLNHPDPYFLPLTLPMDNSCSYHILLSRHSLYWSLIHLIRHFHRIQMLYVFPWPMKLCASTDTLFRHSYPLLPMVHPSIFPDWIRGFHLTSENYLWLTQSLVSNFQPLKTAFTHASLCLTIQVYFLTIQIYINFLLLILIFFFESDWNYLQSTLYSLLG